MSLANKQWKDDAAIPVIRLRLRDSANGPELAEVVQTPLFIKGPISVAWMGASAKLPGKALHVATAVQWLVGMNASKPFKLTRKAQDLFGISIDAAQDGLKALEAAGLVKLVRSPGKRPMIVVIKR